MLFFVECCCLGLFYSGCGWLVKFSVFLGGEESAPSHFKRGNYGPCHGASFVDGVSSFYSRGESPITARGNCLGRPMDGIGRGGKFPSPSVLPHSAHHRRHTPSLQGVTLRKTYQGLRNDKHSMWHF